MTSESNNITNEAESLSATGTPGVLTSRDEEGCMPHGQFRQYQVNMRYKQIQTELLVSIVLGAAICTVFWDRAPLWVLFLWAASTIMMVGIRALFVYNSDDLENAEDDIAWVEFYAYVVVLSGVCWGSLGIIGAFYGGIETNQLTMLILACISVAAYISMQSSPHMVTAFMLPALLPNGLWFLIQSDSTMRSLGIVALVTFWLMQTSSRVMREVLIKSLNLSTHNNELIHKLVAARESAVKATNCAKKTNIQLQNEIRERREAQNALFVEKESAQVILASIVDGVIRTDVHGVIEYMNETAEKGIGLKLEDCIGRPLMEVFNIVDEKTLKTPQDPSRTPVEKGKSIILPGYLQLIHSFHNERLSVEVIASPIRDANSDISGVVIVFHDVTESRSLSKMTYQATHDSLTGLINRREFERRVRQALENARSKDESYALCYLDLDNFKLVNDTCGHNAGDELLKQLSSRLTTVVRESDSVARLGGDEFGILLNGCSMEWAHNLAEEIRMLVEEFRFVWNNQGFRIGVSVGLVNINEDSGTLSDILSSADSACYVAKENGGNRIHKYTDNDNELVKRQGQMLWVQKIHTVLEENRFRLFFQKVDKLSKVARENDKIHGEVLLRMLDENSQLIGPGSFIPAAERYNLMPAIDRWVVENTFRFLSANMGKLYNRLDKCCINLSGQSLSDDRFMSFIIEQISNSKIPPPMLCFEITETAVIANMNTASGMIAKLRKMGCHFALDDFGVGLSSFAYLSNLGVDYLKVDGSFVRNMRNNKTDLEMVRAINQIGHTVNVLTIAEFVEDAETLALIRDIGVDYAQGYAASKPCPIEVALLRDIDEHGADVHQEGNDPYLKLSSSDI